MRSPLSIDHKVDGFWGDNRGTYIHEGEDWNGKGGGNTDFDTPIHPITYAEIVHVSFSNKDFGNIVVYLIIGAWGERWVRCCHLNDILVKVGDHVIPEQVIATMGNTGNSEAAHLHWDIRKNPYPTWRAIVKDQKGLECYEKPTEFLTVWKNEEGVSMPSANMYKGLDLNNPDSMKVAVDKWDELVNQKIYIKKEECENAMKVELEKVKNESKTEQMQLVREIEQLKTDQPLADKFLSKKWITTLVAILLPVVNQKFGLNLSDQELFVLMGVGLYYIGVEGFTDFKERTAMYKTLQEVNK